MASRLRPFLRGGIGRSRDMLYWELRQDGGLGQAVRMGDWKVIRPAGKTRREDCELYNLKKDPPGEEERGGTASRDRREIPQVNPLRMTFLADAVGS